ncbi:hypothetical protein FRB90_009105 [Tulasnella sp. 427]|nr:hypothetical protein FRB90_009105 [Tulasnella sp. 427]
MPTVAEFKIALEETPESRFTLDFEKAHTFVRLEKWELRMNPSTSNQSLLNFVYEHGDHTSIYVHLKPGQLSGIAGRRLKYLLAFAVERATAGLGLFCVEIAITHPIWASIDN